MEVTATIDLRTANSSQMRAYERHTEHDPNATHENKMIVKSDRDLNRFHVLNNEEDVLTEQYGNYLNERQEKLTKDLAEHRISRQQFDDRRQTVKQYVYGSNGSKEKKVFTSAVMTVADSETQQDMLDQLGFSYEMIGVGEQNDNGEYEHFRPQLTDEDERKEWAELWDRTYTQTAKDISNESLRAISVTTNLDEGGGAHAHVKFVNMGKTDKGKPSSTMNAALKAMYGHKDSRVNLKDFRAEYDSIMIKNFNNTAQGMGLNVHLDMIRTGQAGSVDMPTYKANKKKEQELVNKLNDVNNEHVANEYELEEKARELDERETSLDKREKSLLKRIEEGIENWLIEHGYKQKPVTPVDVEAIQKQIAETTAQTLKSIENIDTRAFNEAKQDQPVNIQQEQENGLKRKQQRIRRGNLTEQKDDGLEL